MKRLFIIFAILLFTAGIVSADVVFHNDKQPTLAWDAVTTDVDSDPITGVSYKLYLANADTDPDKANPVVVAETSDLSVTITLSKGRFYAGVQTWLGDQSSVINWGDELINQDNVELFGLRWAVPPHPPKDIKR